MEFTCPSELALRLRALVFRSNKFLIIIIVIIASNICIVDLRLCNLLQFSFAFVGYFFDLLFIIVDFFLVVLVVCFLCFLGLLESNYLVRNQLVHVYGRTDRRKICN